MLLIKLHEMTYRRPKIKDAIDDHVHQIVENWCLIYAAKSSGLHKDTINHWAGELVAQMEPGLDKLNVSGMSPRAQRKLIDEVLLSDAKLDNASVVSRMVRRKFLKEGYSDDLLGKSAQAWVAEGLPRVVGVYRGDEDISVYEQELCR